jgi:hypothetical protein
MSAGPTSNILISGMIMLYVVSIFEFSCLLKEGVNQILLVQGQGTLGGSCEHGIQVRRNAGDF